MKISKKIIAVSTIFVLSAGLFTLPITRDAISNTSKRITSSQYAYRGNNYYRTFTISNSFSDGSSTGNGNETGTISTYKENKQGTISTKGTKSGKTTYGTYTYSVEGTRNHWWSSMSYKTTIRGEYLVKGSNSTVKVNNSYSGFPNFDNLR